MSDTAAQRLLRNDSRTATVAAHEFLPIPATGVQALLRALRTGETVLALYRQGLSFAALTGDALILLNAGSTTRVPRPLAILRPAYGVRQSVDVSAGGRRVTLWGSRVDKDGGLLVRAGEPVTAPPSQEDPLAAVTAAGESVSLPDGHKKVLVEELEPGEAVRAVYHDGWGYAVLTTNGLVLLGNLASPRARRVPLPLPLLRRASGMLDSVEILVDGKPRTLHGSKIDPKGELLEAAGDPLPAGSPLRPGRGTRMSTWVRRHPVLVSVLTVGVVLAGLSSGSGSGDEAPVAQDAGNRTAAVVPDFQGSTLTTAAAQARDAGWRTVSASDATSAFRPVETDAPGWRVCFQSPSREETLIPSGRTLRLYAVPEREECPTRLHGPRHAVVPDLVGERFDDASRILGDLGLQSVFSFHAHTGKRLDGEGRDLADWRVCRQQPDPDTKISALEQVDLWLIGPGDPCTEPSPNPEPKPKPKPEPKPAPKPDPQPSYHSTSGGGSTGGATGGGTGGTTGGSTGGSSSSGGGSSEGSGSGSGSGVGFGQSCSPVGATATTADGRPAKCFMGKDGQARWGYNSG
ncbi:PASTA domain-containing protein [Streptomyces griseoloalbus]|uniref:Putative membrane protein YgcG n=1 Tax=Streptomyces griseoloalbus TaxID=67303 RepID=A0A7W8F972_9ACTN|nr:PASTA domain-containing protein [Streptomyces albaduncus]MBB5125870.1 putative membrane protein YgcG [Streptomyces albaduncus]GGW48348.1 hypothetical protein GCM10010340_28260 [Streptomyces albaduncus]